MSSIDCSCTDLKKGSMLEVLWNTIHARLYSFICYRVSYEDDAEDILQTVFLRIHTHLDDVRDLDRLEGWIYQIARNSITDYYRERSKFVRLTDIAMEDDKPEPEITESLVTYIKEIVYALPAPYRDALLLTEYEGITQQELANHLGISLSAAKSRVQRARQKVKETLLACCHIEFDRRGSIYEIRKRCCCCGE